MIHLFIEGGFLWMSILTMILIALLMAGWKAPAWVKPIGYLALVAGVLGNIFGFRNAAHAVMITGDISPTLLWGGIRVACISVSYGCLIYAASLIIRIVQKPTT